MASDSPRSTDLRSSAIDAFRAAFGGEPIVTARAPGRVELLGNHTDYNGGLVLAAAVDRFTVAVGRPTAERAARLVSASFPGVESFELDEITAGEPGRWGRYARGVAWALQEAVGVPFTAGIEAALAGDIPLGAGLSSSASLQATLAFLLFGARLLPGETPGEFQDEARMNLARTLQRSENAFVGVASGLLDQFTVLFGRDGHALTLDCRTLAFERLPLGDPAPAIVICDSKTSRRLADGMYNTRRDECERVVAYFQGKRPGVTQLRDITLDDLSAEWDALNPVGRKRARHVLTENERVRRGAESLRGSDVTTFGRLMSASHASSRDDFENSSAALDALIEAAEAAPGFLGGKLSGAGWAGCTVNLVANHRAPDFAESVIEGYRRRMNVTPDVHICKAAGGAALL